MSMVANIVEDSIVNRAENRPVPMMIENQVLVPVERWEHLPYLEGQTVQIYGTKKLGEAFVSKKDVSYQGELEPWYREGKSMGYIMKGAAQFVLTDGMWIRQPERNVVTLTKYDFEARAPHADAFVYQTVKKAAY